jgi:hypothetical protein
MQSRLASPAAEPNHPARGFIPRVGFLFLLLSRSFQKLDTDLWIFSAFFRVHPRSSASHAHFVQ